METILILSETWYRSEMDHKRPWTSGWKFYFLCLRKSFRNWSMAPCAEASVWCWPSPRFCVSLAAPCLTSHLDLQPNASILCTLAGWSTKCKHGVKVFLQHHCLCLQTKQDCGCKCEWIVLQMLRRKSSASHVDGLQQPDSDLFCNKSPQWWNKAGRNILEQDLAWRC